MGIILVITQSCEKESDKPTMDFFWVIEGYTVTFTSVVTNTDSYLWDFGDGTTSTEAHPVHTYEVSGDYDVTLTVKGNGKEGSYTKSFRILPTDFEIICGGSSKTWILSTAYVSGVNGAGSTAADLSVSYELMEGILYPFGLGAEYENEYTFNADGTMTIDNKGGTALSAIIYGMMSGLPIVPSADPQSWPFCSMTIDPPSEATWSLNTDDLTVDCATFSFSTGGTTEETVTWSGERWLQFGGGGFLGYLDFRTEVFIKELGLEYMETAHFLTNSPDYGGKPGMMVHFRFVPKDE